MELKDALQELARMVKNEIILNLHSPVGINQKVGTNTLIGSNLEKSIDVKVMGDNTLVFVIAGYYNAITAGRRPNAKRPPIDAIEKWIDKKHIDISKMGFKSITSAAYVIANNIAKNGIKARGFIGFDENEMVNGEATGNLDKILPFLDDFFDKWSDDVFEMITNEIDKFFNQ